MKVEEAGPVTITLSTWAWSPPSMVLELIDSRGAVAYSRDFGAVTSAQATVILEPGLYQLRLNGGNVGGRGVAVNTTCPRFVWPSGTRFYGFAADIFRIKFFVPLHVERFWFYHASHELGCITMPNGAPQECFGSINVELSGPDGTVRTRDPGGFWVADPASQNAFWQVRGWAELLWSMAIGGIPPWFAESEAAWFDPDVWTPSVKGDFNGDQRAEIVWRNEQSGANGLWFMDGTEIVNMTMLPSASAPWNLRAAADMDGDGHTDLIWRDDTTGQNVIWFMNGAATVANLYFPSASTDWSIAGAGDFNGDGRADLVWRNSTTGANGIWYMRGITVLGSALTAGADPAWSIAGVADMNGDGSPDLVWRNYTTGQNGVWLMSGPTPIGSLFFPDVGPAWRLEGVADLNGDGKPDFVWRNYSTGQNVVWFTDGATITASAFITGASPEWAIAGPR